MVGATDDSDAGGQKSDSSKKKLTCSQVSLERPSMSEMESCVYCPTLDIAYQTFFKNLHNGQNEPRLSVNSQRREAIIKPVCLLAWLANFSSHFLQIS